MKQIKTKRHENICRYLQSNITHYLCTYNLLTIKNNSINFLCPINLGILFQFNLLLFYHSVVLLYFTYIVFISFTSSLIVIPFNSLLVEMNILMSYVV